MRTWGAVVVVSRGGNTYCTRLDEMLLRDADVKNLFLSF